MSDLVEINKFPVKDVLKYLLQDKTTGKNIIFATNMYSDYGYSERNPMTEIAVLGFAACDIQPRVRKAQAEQTLRTRKKAEVFTPTWICNMMNNYCDSEWFGCDGVFNRTDSKNHWYSTTEPVTFPKGRTWQQYVDSRRLEITCGEAPYLVSRYDTTTGELIPIKERIGLLDRKLRVVNENAADETEWLQWTERAFNSIYGYEFQGDNLLIARINLLMTFCDYLKDRWNREAAKTEIKKFANIISWNLWQMDGLSDTVPVGIPEDNFEQMTLFGDNEKEIPSVECKIQDWRDKRPKIFKAIKDKNERGVNMKFDFVIGNPPYQDQSGGDKKADASVYNFFMEEAYKIGNKVELITPARFLFDNGNTPKPWNKKMLSDIHFKVLMFESDGSVFFPNNDIKGGVAIHYRNVDRNYGAIQQFTAFTELNSILKKVLNKNEVSITTIIHNQNKFNLKELYKDYPQLKSIISSGGKEKRLTSGCINYECFHNEKETNNDIRVLGIVSNKRCYKYINRKYLELPHPNLEKYKVVVPANNGSGAIGEVLSTPLIGTPLIGYTQTFISFGSFDTEEIANAAMKYIKSKFCRVMLGILKVTQNGKKDVWKYVPLQDFTENSDIDWSKSIPEIDKQLYKKYGLTQEEIDFIESHVKEMN